jgi:hypothetical protein
MLSRDIIAFPVMSFGTNASLNEVQNSQWHEEKMKKYYQEFIDYLIDNRTVRLFYSHPHDIPDYNYKNAVKYFLDYASAQVDAGKLQTRTMTNISDFIVRLVNTKKQFTLDAKGIHIQMYNQASLDEMVIAVPKRIGKNKVQSDDYPEDENYYYIPLSDNKNDVLVDVSFESLE